MAAVNYNIAIEQGATFRLSVVWKDSNGDLVDLTTYTARMQIRPSVTSSTVLVDLLSGDGIVLGGTAGSIEVTISATETAALKQGGVYDLELDNGGVVKRLMYGSVSFSREVTR